MRKVQAEEKVCLRPRLRSRGRTPDGQPNQIDVHIGRRIRRRWLVLGWTQQKLSDMLGLTFQQIQKYEKGLNRVSGSRLYDFACILGVDVGFFYEDMPADIRRQSPRHISTDQPVVDEAAEDRIARPADPMRSNRALNIIRSFEQISHQQVADALYDLILLLGTSSWRLHKMKRRKDK